MIWGYPHLWKPRHLAPSLHLSNCFPFAVESPENLLCLIHGFLAIFYQISCYSPEPTATPASGIPIYSIFHLQYFQPTSQRNWPYYSQAFSKRNTRENPTISSSKPWFPVNFPKLSTQRSKQKPTYCITDPYVWWLKPLWLLNPHRYVINQQHRFLYVCPLYPQCIPMNWD